MNEVAIKPSYPFLDYKEPGTIIENPLYESCTQATESRDYYKMLDDTAGT